MEKYDWLGIIFKLLLVMKKNFIIQFVINFNKNRKELLNNFMNVYTYLNEENKIVKLIVINCTRLRQV